jgi:hypothetical protein
MTTTKQIIECGTLKYKMEQINDDEGDELLESAHRDWKAAFAQLEPADYGAMFAVQAMLEGNPYSLTTDDPEDIRRCIAVANEMGATVEVDPRGNPFLGPQPDIRTITVRPPLQPVQ